MRAAVQTARKLQALRQVIEAKVEAIHVDQVRPDQSVTLRFSAFNQQVTRKIEGRIVSV